MFLSFLIVAQNNPVKLIKTLSSIGAQTEQDFEVILVDDTGFQPKSVVLDFMSEHFYQFNNQIKVITNLRSQGFSYSMNTGINNASGDYIVFVKEGEVLHENLVETLKKTVAEFSTNNKTINLLEFGIQYANLKKNSYSRLATDKLLSPKTNKEVLAYVHPLLHTKAFNREMLIKKQIYFVNYTRNETFFIYKVLAYADGVVAVKDILADYDLEQVKYSVFDLLKQWVHIFNFYREHSLYKEYYDELEYAYVRFCLVSFLRLVRLQHNKQLAIKAINSAENKVDRRIKSFMKNKYAKNISEPKFRIIAEDIKGYIKAWRSEFTR
ncbi:glycosyltransferase [Spiroplasma syrphidicola EA-1]|uniref:Glycosyltransferase n=1 Tax=Spiroplasma syrphidicola EA-1 TaxID=1276229 RepID=R4UD49_9MOLU|nr:glycosyltransferase [Spiroplasma syrphidicola]AGM25839.1 glycosyltransferase [Spiroplasma syrphidicola EA-1]